MGGVGVKTILDDGGFYEGCIFFRVLEEFEEVGVGNVGDAEVVDCVGDVGGEGLPGGEGVGEGVEGTVEEEGVEVGLRGRR